MTTRRSFLGAMLAACAAPALVRADSLMRVIPRETEILLPEAPPAIEQPAPVIRDGSSLEIRGGALRVGDLFTIAGMTGIYAGKQFRVTAVEDSCVALALPEVMQRRIEVAAAPWFRQHEKRGRR